jgi:hypothetical protein
MFEALRHHDMKWFAERRQIDIMIPKDQLLVSTAFERIQELTKFQTRHYRFLPTGETYFEVFSLATTTTYTVNLNERKFTCFQWQKTGLPCSHAIAAILSHKKDPQTFAQSFYTLDSYRKTYANPIFSSNADKADDIPIFEETDDSNIDEEDFLPPHASRSIGRPRKKRIHSGVEGPFGNKRAKNVVVVVD